MKNIESVPMFPETTLFGILLVMAISFTLIFFLIRKPQVRFRGTPARGSTRKGQKTSKDEEVKRKPKTHPHHLGRLDKPLEKAPTPEEYLDSAKTREYHVESATRRTLPQKEGTPEKPAPVVQTVETTKKPSELVEERKAPIPTARPQLRPPSCSHFFGYLKKAPKHSAMPDECFGCPKMVECLYYNIITE